MTRVLVVHYSRSGNTRKVAEEIARALDAETDVIVDPTNRSGLWGYLRSGRQAFFRRIVPIADAIRRPGTYDLVVIGTPVWNMSLSAPVRSYLRRYRQELPAVAFFCTCGGAGMNRVFRQMTEESGRTPVANLTVLEAEVGSASLPQKIGKFIEDVRAALPTAPVSPARQSAPATDLTSPAA